MHDKLVVQLGIHDLSKAVAGCRTISIVANHIVIIISRFLLRDSCWVAR